MRSDVITAAEPQTDPVKLVIVGHVDHGKSTLVGRLLHETGALSSEKLERLKAISAKRGQALEWAFLLDSFQAERDQGVTIDVSRIRFATAARPYVVIDAPGHVEFLKNMVTGAADAEAALLMVDASEGLKEQTRRHAYLLRLLGVEQVAVVVTKMDLVGYDQQRFSEIARDVRAYLQELGADPQVIIPISAREGENIAAKSDKMTWYDGSTVLEALDTFTPRRPPAFMPLRLPVQDVYKFDERRIIAGTIAAGQLRQGDTLLFSPSGKTARVESIETWSAPEKLEAKVGESIGVTLDRQIFVERGELASHIEEVPVLTNVFRGRVFWLDDQPLKVGDAVKLRINSMDAEARVQAIERVIDTESLSGGGADAVNRNEVAEIVLRTRSMLALDEARANPETGRFVISRNFRIVGGGVISMEGYPDQREAITVRSTNITASESEIDRSARWRRNGHRGGVYWLTGLSGSGKSTIARETERQLFLKGFNVYVLDGDNVRTGLNANLGFSPEDRAENIRRVGEVASLFADSGTIVLASFISPYQSDRDRARQAAGDSFHEVYIKADLSVCETRDPKGLYKKARAGEIPEFTGISAPYEAPEAPECTVDTDADTPDESAAQLVAYIEKVCQLTD
jgi:bifunctional enzyme CysN/CysC